MGYEEDRAWGRGGDRGGGSGDESQPLQPPFQLPSGLRSGQPASLWPTPFCSCLQWLLGVPWNLLFTGCIIRSRGCGAEGVTNTLSSGHIGVDWHPPMEVGGRAGSEPGVRDALSSLNWEWGHHSASHSAIHPALSLLSSLPRGKSLDFSGPPFSHVENRIDYNRTQFHLSFWIVGPKRFQAAEESFVMNLKCHYLLYYWAL